MDICLRLSQSDVSTLNTELGARKQRCKDNDNLILLAADSRQPHPVSRGSSGRMTVTASSVQDGCPASSVPLTAALALQSSLFVLILLTLFSGPEDDPVNYPKI